MKLRHGLASLICLSVSKTANLPGKSFSLSSSPVTDAPFPPIPGVTSHESLASKYRICIEFPKMELELEKFSFNLKTYSDNWGFDVDAFESASKELYGKLMNISLLADGVKLCKPLSQKFKFVQKMFQDMDLTVHKLKRYNFLGSKTHRLIHRVTELNVRLLALFDSSGTPEILREDFVSEISRLTMLLGFWKSDFNRIMDVPFSDQAEFMFQAANANRTLRMLASHLPSSLLRPQGPLDMT